jgi:hypothetical protein
MKTGYQLSLCYRIEEIMKNLEDGKKDKERRENGEGAMRDIMLWGGGTTIYFLPI